MLDITLLPSAKVPLIYPDTNGMTTEWYRFFWNVYGFTGDSTGTVPVSKGGTGLNSIGNHQLIIGNSLGLFERTELIGSGITITYAPGTTTLAIGNSGVTPGTYGSATAVGQFTVDIHGTLVFAQNVPIAIDANQIVSGIINTARISGSYTGITGVGTLTVGTWNATTIGTAYGGTGLTSFTSGGALYATSASVLTSGTLPVTAGGTGQTSFTNGQLLIGNTTGNTLDKATLTAGTGISISNGAGAITITNSSPSLGGDVVGPASATDNAIVRFDTTTGKLIQNSVVTIGDTGAATGFTTLSASTSVSTPIIKATSSAGGALQNTSGTNQIQWGAGGGDNVTIDVSTNINGTNAQIDISPTGTGHVHINPTGVNSIQINPTYVGTMDNMTIGATTPKAITGTTVTATTFSGSGSGLTSIPNSALTNSTISGVALGGSLFNLTAGTGVSFSAGTTYNGSTAITINATGSGGTVTSVTGTAPVVSSGGTTPAISMAAATTSVSGYLTSTDWNTFNSKQPAGTYVTSISIASSNGFTGTSSGGATPSLTLATSITGILKGNGTAISAATSGTDYAPATSGTSILYGNGSGGFSNVTIGTGVSFAGGTLSATGSGGTVTSVAALTLGTTGTDLSSTVANSTTTPVITLNVPTASAANRGALSAADWSTFNGKQTALVSGTNIKTVGGVSLLGSGDVGTIGTGYGGTGLSTFTANRIFYASSTSVMAQSAGLTFDGSNFATTGDIGGVNITASGSLLWGSSGTYAAGCIYADTNWGAIFRAKTASPGSAIFMWADSAGTELMRISTTNNLLVGTTSAINSYGKIGVSGASAAGAGIMDFVNTGAATKKWQIGPDSNGNFVVFNDATTGAYIAYGGTTWTPNISDERLKNKVSGINNALDAINKLEPLSYYYKNQPQTGVPNYGFFAQNVGQAIPDAQIISPTVDSDLGEVYTYDPNIINIYLVKAIQELSSKFDAYVASHP